MTKKIVALVIAVTSLSAEAATITLNKGLSPGFNYTTSTGVSIGGTVVAIGTFAGGVAPATPGDGDYTAILASFKTFGTTTAPVAGTAISGSITTIPGTPADFNTLQMYIIIGNAATLAGSTEIFIGTNSPVTNFPADTTAAGSTNFNVNVFSAVVPVAGAGSKTDNASGADTLRLVPVVVPEPSTSLIMSLVGLGMLARRRR